MIGFGVIVLVFVLGLIIGSLIKPSVSAVYWRSTTDLSTGERCRHAWIRVRTDEGWPWLRLTQGELLEASRRAQTNIKDAPPW